MSLIRSLISVTRTEILTRQLCPTLGVANIRFHKTTRKIRKTHPFHWWVTKDKRRVPSANYLTPKNKQFIDDFIKDKYELKAGESPLKCEPFERGEYTPGSQRCGLIAKKIGVYPIWSKTGHRMMTTVLQVVDNHVIKYYTPEQFAERSRPFYQHHRYAGLAVMVVGAQSGDPRKFTASYCGLFEESGIMPKNKITRFFVTENAKLPLGTPLYATHFRAGDYVCITGKSIDHGFQGVIKLHKKRGLPKAHGVTKAHNRGGSINVSRKLRIFKGAKMPGHMGAYWSQTGGLKVWRINTKHNILWIQGNVPGNKGDWVYVYDTKSQKKRYSDDNPPPFPTFFPEDASEPLPEDIYDKDMHVLSEPTIIFEETEAERKAALTAAKAVKKAKVAKIR